MGGTEGAVPHADNAWYQTGESSIGFHGPHLIYAQHQA